MLILPITRHNPLSGKNIDQKQKRCKGAFYYFLIPWIEELQLRGAYLHTFDMVMRLESNKIVIE